MMRKLCHVLLAVCVIEAGVAAHLHFNKPSWRTYSRRLDRVAEAIGEYRETHNRMPATLADLGRPELVVIDGRPVEYTCSGSNYVLTIETPFQLGLEPGTHGSPAGSKGGCHVSSRIVTMYAIPQLGPQAETGASSRGDAEARREE